MKKKNYGCYYRRVRTTQERRFSYDGEHKNYVRGKRRGCNIPSSYDDIASCVQKTWKVKRKRQYREGRRGKKNEVVVGKWSTSWNFQEYCEEHNIPFAVEEVREYYTYQRPEIKRVKDLYVPAYSYCWPKERQYQVGFVWTYKRVETGHMITYKSWRIREYKLIWWSDKDIGIEYIIR